MKENKLAHLGFIQVIITRLATNSFLIKGWCVTLVAALTALSSGTKDQYIFIAYLPIAIFWFLDAYYLWQERLYRMHYDEVRVKKENDIDFSMKLSAKTLQKQTYFGSFFSRTVFPFYAVLLGTVLIFMFVYQYEQTRIFQLPLQ